MIYAFVYLVFSLVYYELGGTSLSGKPYIYSVVNWEKPGKVIAICVLIVVILFVLHLFVFMIKSLQVRSTETQAYYTPSTSTNGQENSNHGTSNIAFTDTEIDITWTSQLKADLGFPEPLSYSRHLEFDSCVTSKVGRVVEPRH